MLTRIELNNFKKHEHFVAEFKEGLIAIKGANEAGKSTLYHAVLYALFGSRALPMTLAETVTYDKPESSLRVTLDFKFEGVQYRIVRSKAGAQIGSSQGVANGQAEVTRYVEGLFGVSADSATKLMIASQNGLRGALESNDAIQLIEKLANLDLIDNLIKEIQNKLPCGNTSLMENSIANYDSLTAPVLNTEDVDATVTLAAFAVADLNTRKAELEAQQSPESLGQALDTLQKFSAATVRLDTLQSQLPHLESRAAVAPLPPVEGQVEQLEKELAEDAAAVSLRKVYTKFTDFKQPQVEQPSGATATIRGSLAHQVEAAQKARTNLTLAKAAIIKETSCGLCGKDLQNVPEVVAKNKVFESQAAVAQENLAALEETIAELRTSLAQAEAYDMALTKLQVAKAAIGDYAEIRYDPLRLQWTGPAVPDAGDKLDYAALLAAAKADVRRYEAEVATVQAANLQLAQVKQQIAGVELDYAGATEARAVVSAAEELKKSIEIIAGSLTSASAKLKEAEWAQAAAVKRHDAAITAYEVALEAKAELQKQLAIMCKHNALIKKLRAVRPQVAAQLWSIVLSGVSIHFSAIRGTQSVVTRSADSFLVDGRPAKGLSGSTLDSLGLAIRVALNKTFLPSIQFLLLDEPAAGMSDEREAAMLGLLAALDYKQVLVVTHSNLADSFSADTVQI